MKIELLTSKSALEDMERFAALATLTCHDNTDRMNVEGYKPSDTLKNIIRLGHESILEHINLTFSVKELSRACLQELARHRHISLSVESTRHTLKQQLKAEEITIFLPDDINIELKQIIIGYLKSLVDYINKHPDTPNDELKYAVPECVCTNLCMSMNVRELRHIITLRSAPQALKEFQDFAKELFEVVPQEFQYLLEGCVYKKKGDNN